MSDSIFTKIINGEIPSHIVYEDDRVIAFLTTHPLVEGHTLVVPKQQIDQLWDLDDETYVNLWKTAQKIALHLREVMNVDRVGVVVKGFEVPHTHIHLLPVNHHSGVLFDQSTPPPTPPDNELIATAQRLRF